VIFSAGFEVNDGFDPEACLMNKYVFILFVGFGLVDFLYGIYSRDRVSLVVGPVIIAITAYIAGLRRSADG